MRHLTFLVFFLLLGVGFALNSTSAQAQTGDSCPVFVEQAMAQVGDTCSNMGRNVACYGYDAVTASFYDNVSLTEFDAPADRIALTSLRSIRTAPLNEVTQEWGIALLNTQANLPNTAPGQSVVMMLVGDAQIENMVEPSELTFTGETIPVSATYNANLRHMPSLNGRVIDSVASGTTLHVDMLSADGAWLRVAQDDGSIAWVSREVIANSQEIDNLSRPEATRMSPMQAFYFTAGLGQVGCSQASGTVFIQGPNNIVVDLEVNGAEISIGSTIALSFNDARELQVATLSGTAYVEGVAVPAGYTVTAQVDANGNVLQDTWRAAQPMVDSDLARYDISGEIPDNLLHYHIDAQLPIIITDANGSNGVGCNCSNNTGGNANNNGNGTTIDNGNNAGNGGNITETNCPGNSCNSNGNGNGNNTNCPGNSCNSNGNNGGGNGNANGNGNGNNGNGNGNCGNGNGNGNANGC